MRILLAIATLCIAGCAGQPPTRVASAEPIADAAGAAAARPAKKKVVAERIKGPYKVVMRGDEKLYCTKELATGSHVNYRTICLTPEEYADLEASARQWKDGMQGVIPPNQVPTDPRMSMPQ
jgi:hypothetical protein